MVTRICAFSYWSSYKTEPTDLGKLLGTTPSELRLFVVAQGEKGLGFGDQPLTDFETNMKEAGRIPSGQTFVVNEIEHNAFTSVLALDFVNTRFDLAPGWAGARAGELTAIKVGNLLIPGGTSFAVVIKGNLLTDYTYRVRLIGELKFS